MASPLADRGRRILSGGASRGRRHGHLPRPCAILKPIMRDVEDAAPTNESTPGLARRLGLFDATMVVMGGIVGSGIFMNPYVVARQVHTPFLILAAWSAGGAIALLGAFIYAELAERRPRVGGQYAYIREAFHPLLAFMYAWGLLLVTQTGGMAAVAVTFARYFRELTNAPLADGAVAVLAIGVLTAINCLGVRAGSGVQSALDRKSTRLNSSHSQISYAVFCLKKKKRGAIR